MTRMTNADALLLKKYLPGSEGYEPNGAHDHEEADLPPLPPLPPFPMEVLPEVVRRYVEECADAIPVQPQMVAIPLIGLTGGLIGNRAHIALKSSWAEYAGLWTLIIAPPGSSKTAALSLARWPIKKLQEAEAQRYRVAREEYVSAKLAWKSIPTDQRGNEPRPPVFRSYFSTDINLEALAARLEDAPGISYASEELAAWVKKMNQYRKGADLEQYLSLWSAESWKVDRKEAASVFLRRPVVSVVGGTQPDVIPTLFNEIDNGFPDRFVPCFSDPFPPQPWDRNTGVSMEAYADIAARYRRIDDLLPILDPMMELDGGEHEGIAIRMSLEAEEAWGAWYFHNRSIADDLTHDGQAFLGGCYLKLEAHVARLALILHVLSAPDPRIMISRETMEGAIELGEWIRGHVERFAAMVRVDPPAKTPQRSIIDRLISLLERKGERITYADSLTTGNEQSGVCLPSQRVFGGLRGVTKDLLTSELNTYTKKPLKRRISVISVSGRSKPSTLYCLDDAQTSADT